MTARFLLVLFDSVFILTMGIWFGSLVFMTWAVVPLLASSSPNDALSRFIRSLYTRFYAWCATAGAISLPAFFGVPLSFPEFRGPHIAVEALALLSCILLMFYGGNNLTPALVLASGIEKPDGAQIRVIRRRLLTTNVIAIVISSCVLIAFANRPAPKTSGIQDSNLSRPILNDSHEIVGAMPR